MSLKKISLLLFISLMICIGSLFYCDLYFHTIQKEELSLSYYSFLTPTLYALIRGIFLLIILSTLLIIAFVKRKIPVTLINNGRKFFYYMKNRERFTMFTVWSWTLQGLYFSMAFYSTLIESCSYYNIILPPMPKVLYSVAWVLYEISFCVSFFVSIVTSFILIPHTKRSGINVEDYFYPLALIMHNLNITFMCFEFLTNNLKIYFSHIIFIIIYSICYVLFAWYWYKLKGIFHYYFLDYERPDALYWYLGLLMAVTFFFSLGTLGSYIHFYHGRIWSSTAITSLTYATYKIKDT